MKITIKTPQEIVDERVKLIERAVLLMDNGEKYNARLKRKLQWILYQIRKIDRSLNGE